MKHKAKNQKFYYGFEFWGNENTTMGEYNARSRGIDIAGSYEKFSVKKNRDKWVAFSKRHERIACSKKELRQFCRGTTKIDFENSLSDLLTWEKREEGEEIAAMDGEE